MNAECERYHAYAQEQHRQCDGIVVVPMLLLMQGPSPSNRRTAHPSVMTTLAQGISSRCEVLHYPLANPTFRDGHHKPMAGVLSSPLAVNPLADADWPLGVPAKFHLKGRNICLISWDPAMCFIR